MYRFYFITSPKGKMMTTGRPLKFNSVEELENAINKYFDECNEETNPITITGLALALDTSRETLCNYEEKAEFFDTIKRAKLRVQNAYEKRLVKRGNGGDIFALKNFGWVDKTEVDSKLTLKQALVGFDDGNSQSNDTNEV